MAGWCGAVAKSGLVLDGACVAMDSSRTKNVRYTLKATFPVNLELSNLTPVPEAA